MEKNDEELIKQILKGDINCYKDLIGKYQNPVFRVIYKIIGEQEEAKELTQDVFVCAYESLRQYNPDYKFFSWIYRIAINRALLFEKQKQKFKPIDDSVHLFTVEDDKKTDDRDALLKQMIDNLNEHYKSVILLKYYAGLSYTEISDSLAIPEKTVKSRLFDARKILKEKMMSVNFLSEVYD